VRFRVEGQLLTEAQRQKIAAILDEGEGDSSTSGWSAVDVTDAGVCAAERR